MIGTLLHDRAKGKAALLAQHAPMFAAIGATLSDYPTSMWI